jgi:hypothetical protein
MNENDLKKKSLYDNIYFTLRDIFANAGECETFMEANNFNISLTNNISFEDRTERFEYSNALHDIYFVTRLKSWLQQLDTSCFAFEELEDGEECNIHKYMKLDDWWAQCIELKNAIDIQHDKCCKWEEENIGRYMDN